MVAGVELRGHKSFRFGLSVYLWRRERIGDLSFGLWRSSLVYHWRYTLYFGFAVRLAPAATQPAESAKAKHI